MCVGIFGLTLFFPWYSPYRTRGAHNDFVCVCMCLFDMPHIPLLGVCVCFRESACVCVCVCVFWRECVCVCVCERVCENVYKVSRYICIYMCECLSQRLQTL